MFEKEAEEKSLEQPFSKDHYYYGFKEGAEFGYKLAHEEIDYLNKHWRSEEERKANEWHYVKDGDLPKHNHEVLCLMWGGTKEIGYYENEVWHCENFVADNEDVDYWQEIVPPKEIE